MYRNESSSSRQGAYSRPLSANKLGTYNMNDEGVNDLSSSYLSEDSDRGIIVHSKDVEWRRCGNNLDRQSLV